MALISNVRPDIETFPKLPYSNIYKLYEPLSEDIEVKDNVHIVREVMPQYTETVELKPYDQMEDLLHEGRPIPFLWCRLMRDLQCCCF